MLFAKSIKKRNFQKRMRRLICMLDGLEDNWSTGFPLIARTLRIHIRRYNSQPELSKAFLDIAAAKFQPEFVRERLGLIPDCCFLNVTDLEDDAKPIRTYSEKMKYYSSEMWWAPGGGSNENLHWIERSFCVYSLFTLLSSPPVPDDKRIKELYERVCGYLRSSNDNRFALDTQFLALLFSALAFLEIGEGYFIENPAGVY